MYNNYNDLIRIEAENPELFKYSLFVKCPEPENLDYHSSADNYYRTNMKPSFLNPLPLKLKIRPTIHKEIIKKASNVIEGYSPTDQKVFSEALEQSECEDLFYSEGTYCHILKKSIIVYYFSSKRRTLHCMLFKDFTPGNQRELFLKEILRVLRK